MKPCPHCHKEYSGVHVCAGERKITDEHRIDWLQKFEGVFTVSWVAINIRKELGGPILRSYTGTIREAIDTEIRKGRKKRGKP